MRIVGINGYIDTAALFFELTDKQLEIVKDNPGYHESIELMSEFLVSKGDNCHIFRLISNKHSKIRPNIQALLEDYKTVSWWDREMNKFIIKRRK